VLFPAGTIVAVCSERGNRQQPGGEDFDITAPRDGRLLTSALGPTSAWAATWPGRNWRRR